MTMEANRAALLAMESGVAVKAERFDFTFTDHFYKHQLHLDEYGERISSQTTEIGRVVSKEGLIIENYEEEEEW